MEFHPLARTDAAVQHKEEKTSNARFGTKWLSEEQIASFKRDGFLHLKAEDVWTKDELDIILKSADKLTALPDAPGKWMKYYEDNLNWKEGSDLPKKILQRMENFTQYDEGMDQILNGDKMIGANSQLFGEPSVLYKEKINFKLPGGGGFAPHQDVAAGWWMYGQTLHISVLISIDPSNAENGCLEAVAGEHKKGMFGKEFEEIPASYVEQWEKEGRWMSIPTKPGDVLFFDSFVPHRSGPNKTETNRRILYSTYAKASEGDWRTQYYVDKRKSFPPDCERESGKEYKYKI